MTRSCGTAPLRRGGPACPVNIEHSMRSSTCAGTSSWGIRASRARCRPRCRTWRRAATVGQPPQARTEWANGTFAPGSARSAAHLRGSGRVRSSSGSAAPARTTPQQEGGVRLRQAHAIRGREVLRRSDPKSRAMVIRPGGGGRVHLPNARRAGDRASQREQIKKSSRLPSLLQHALQRVPGHSRVYEVIHHTDDTWHSSSPRGKLKAARPDGKKPSRITTRYNARHKTCGRAHAVIEAMPAEYGELQTRHRSRDVLLRARAEGRMWMEERWARR